MSATSKETIWVQNGASKQNNLETNEAIKLGQQETNWAIALFYIYIHIFAIFGIILVFTDAKIITSLFTLLLIMLGSLSLTAGVHRLWAHQTYKANSQLRIFLMLCHTLCGQGTIYDWVLYHRIHHQYFESEMDPYNPKRGFLYSHILCNIKKLTSKQQAATKEIDMSDIETDWIVMFQKKYYWLLIVIVFGLIPINTPAEYWGESWLTSVAIVGCVRYMVLLNIGWFVNSAINVWGLQKGEKYPADTNIVFLLTKNYWLQYHYLVPWDYQTGEYGKYGTDCTTTCIRVFAALGLATSLRTVDSKIIKTAVSSSVDLGKSIKESIHEIAFHSNVTPDDHYLEPTKYC